MINQLSMFFQLTVFAKNKSSLKLFFNFLSNLEKRYSTWNIVFNSVEKEVITILKSPHINKTAQEQFEYRVYTKKIIINSYRPFSFLFIIKKINGLSFPGLALKIHGMSNKVDKLNTTAQLFNPKNFNISLNKEFSKYLQLFDCHGEMLLKTKYASKTIEKHL